MGAKTLNHKAEINWNNYSLRPSLFDSPSEYEFYKILRDEILGERFVALVQIPISSLIGIRQKKEWGWDPDFSRIGQKRIDFLICQKQDLKPLLVVELDGSSHFIVARQKRDAFLDKLFDVVGLPVLRVPRQPQYHKAAIALLIALKMGLEARVIKRLEALVNRDNH